MSEYRYAGQPYLYIKRDIYYFRRQIKPTFKQHLDCSEIKKSLKTKNLGLARARCAMISLACDDLWGEMDAMKALLLSDLPDLMRDYFRERLDHIGEIADFGPDPTSGIIIPEEIAYMETLLPQFKIDAVNGTASKSTAVEMQSFLNDHNYAIPPTHTDTYRETVQLIARANAEAIRVTLARLKGDFTETAIKDPYFIEAVGLDISNEDEVSSATIETLRKPFLKFHDDNADTLSIATLERRLAALSKIHKPLGDDNPVRKELVRTTMRGIRRSKGVSQRQVAPITKERLLAMLHVCDDGLRGLRDKALLLVGFAAALRRSELVALNCTNIDFAPEGMIITLKRSKTDQEGKGRKIGIPYAQGDICPVKALKQYLMEANISKGPILRPMSGVNKLAKTRLTSASVALAIKCRAKQAGMDPSHFSGHSLRAGFATSAAQAGAETWAIMKQTGHKSEKTVRRYIREGELFRSNAMSSIL